MEIVVANLYKRFQTGSKPRETNGDTFLLIGHFDYLQFKIVPFKRLSDQYNDWDTQREIHPAWPGFHFQSLYLLRIPNADDKPLEGLVSSKREELPFCVMATIEDSDKFNIEGPPFQSEDVIAKLSAYRAKYVDAFEAFKKNRADKSGIDSEMEVFFTLSCIDTVLLFRTNSFSLIHDFIFELYMKCGRLMSYTMYGISEGYGLDTHRDLIGNEEDLCLSMRVSFNPNIDYEKMRETDDLIGALTNNQSVSSVPAGRYHRLYYIEQGVYNVLDACLNAAGQLSLSNPEKEYYKYINGYRFTLSFGGGTSASEYTGIHDEGTSENGICEATKSVYKTFKRLNRHWKEQLNRAPEANVAILTDLMAYTITVENNMREYMYFFACMDSHTRHMINSELSSSIIELLKKLEQLISDFKEYAERLLKEDVDYAITMYRLFLEQIQSVISRFGNQVEDVIHMQQNRMEDRGVYRNDVSASAKLCLGYYSYAQLLSNALFETDTDRVTHNEENPFSFYINLETMSDSVNATEHFSNVLDYQHQEDIPTKGALVGIDVSRQRVSDIIFVKACITHEIAHFVGWRDRTSRVECVIESVCIMLSEYLIPDLHCKNNAPDLVQRFFSEKKNAIKAAAESIRDNFISQIRPVLSRVFKECFNNNLDWAFQKNCEDVLVRILQCWLGSPVTEEQFGDVIVKNYVDIPSLTANLNVELLQRWGDIAFDWIVENGLKPNVVVPYFNHLWASSVFTLNRAINDTKNRIDDLFNEAPFSPASFFNMDYDKKNERLKPRTCKLHGEGDIFGMWRVPENKSLYSLIHAIHNVYSEVYCDLVMVKLLHLSPEQYIDFLYRENQLESDACWRVWSVLKAAYDPSTFSGALKYKVESIRDGAGSYRCCEGAMEKYLNSIMGNNRMQYLFNRESGYFVPSNDKNAEDDNILYLYACYLKLHG